MTCQLTDQQIEGLLSKFTELITDVFDEADRILDLEVDLSNKGLKEDVSRGFWNDFFDEGQFDLQEALANNEAFNPLEVQSASVQYNSILTTLFGGPAVVPAVDLNSAENLSGKTDGAFDSLFALCGSSVSAIDTVQGIVNIQKQKVSRAIEAVKATFGILVAENAEVGPAVLTLAIRNFLVRITAQNFLLKQIQDTIGSINREIAEMDDGDYSINHKTLLSAAILKLNGADNLLRTQLNNVLNKFPFNIKGYEQAEQEIRDVRDALCGIDLQDLFGGYLSGTAIKVTAKLIFLRELLDLLETSDKEAQRIVLNLGSFDTALEDVTFFDELLVPVLQLLRCRLATLQADMQQTIQTNKLSNFIVKEKLWCFELQVLLAIMKAAKVFDIPRNGGILSNAPSLNAIDAVLREVTSFNDIVSIESILRVAEQYTKNVQRKLSFNVPVLPIQARGDLVNRLIEQRIDENESFGLLVNRETLTLEGNLLSGITVVQQFLTSINGVDALNTLGNAIGEGNLRGLFNDEVLESTLVGSVERIFGEVQQSLIDAECSLVDAGSKTLSAYSIFEDVTRSEALLGESLAGFPETHLREAVQGELPKYNQQSTQTNGGFEI